MTKTPRCGKIPLFRQRNEDMKKYTADEIIADLKELVATVEAIKNDPKPDMELGYTFTRMLDHITDKNLGLQVQSLISEKLYGTPLIEGGHGPDGAVNAEC